MSVGRRSVADVSLEDLQDVRFTIGATATRLSVMSDDLYEIAGGLQGQDRDSALEVAASVAGAWRAAVTAYAGVRDLCRYLERTDHAQDQDQAP